MAKFEHNLPAVLIPDDDICVPVSIPNHPDYIKLFLRAVRMLETQRLYQRDETMTAAKTVAAQWRDRTVTPLIETLAQGLGCADERSECLSYPAYAGFIKYFPDNPFDNDNSAPPGYLLPAWWRWGKIESILPDYIDDFINHQIEQFTGYKNNDAICWISSLLSNNWLAWLNNGYVYPAIEIEVTGSGTANITLLSFPLGGRAIIEVDEAPNPVDILTGGVFDPDSFIVDTARDVISFPPEEYPINVIPIEIHEDGDHTIYILFLPVVNPSLSEELIGFGGGIRGVELCGGLRPRNTPEPEPLPPLEGVTELKPIFKFTPDCGLEVRLVDQNGDIVEDYKPVEGWLDNAADCFGGGEMATKAEITEAVVDAFEIGAARFLSGQAGNLIGGVCIDEDGNITVDSGGGDDPSTAFDDAKAAKMGGAEYLAEGIEEFLRRLDDYYGATNGTPVTAAGNTKLYIQTYFPCDNTAMDTAIDDYYTYRIANARILFDSLTSMKREFYCYGANEAAWNRWLIDFSGYSAEKLAMVKQLTEALAPEFWAGYYNAGLLVPSSDYLNAPCEPIETEELVLAAFNTSYFTAGLWKPYHRMQIAVEGHFTDPIDGDIQDAFWLKSGTTGALTFINNLVILQGFGIIYPTALQVPYRADHKYNFTTPVAANGGLNYAAECKINRNASMDVSTPIGTGMKLTIKDLGLYK